MTRQRIESRQRIDRPRGLDPIRPVHVHLRRHQRTTQNNQRQRQGQRQQQRRPVVHLPTPGRNTQHRHTIKMIRRPHPRPHISPIQIIHHTHREKTQRLPDRQVDQPKRVQHKQLDQRRRDQQPTAKHQTQPRNQQPDVADPQHVLRSPLKDLDHHLQHEMTQTHPPQDRPQTTADRNRLGPNPSPIQTRLVTNHHRRHRNSQASLRWTDSHGCTSPTSPPPCPGRSPAHESDR